MGAKSDAIASDLRDECSAEQIEAEVEQTGEPAGPIDSAIAAEMEGDAPDAPMEIPVLDELPEVDYSEVPPVIREVLDHDAPLCMAPAPEQDLAAASEEVVYQEEAQVLEPAAGEMKKRRPRLDAWATEHEDFLAAWSTYEDALAAFRQAYPSSKRSDGAIQQRWKLVQKQIQDGVRPHPSATGGDAPKEADPLVATQQPSPDVVDDPSDPFVPGARVRVGATMRWSPYRGACGRIVRRSSFSDEVLVEPDGSQARIWFSRKDLEIVEERST